MKRIILATSLLVFLATTIYGFSIVGGKEPLGTADNGDFLRVYGTVGIKTISPAWESRPYFEATRRYKRFVEWGESPHTPRGAHTWVVSLFVKVSTLAHRLIHPTQPTFDLSYTGILYYLTAVFAVLVSLRLGFRPWKAAAASLLLLGFSDPEHIVFYNSLYSEPMAFLCLFGATLGIVVVEGRWKWPWTGFFLMALSLIKPQFMASALFFTICLVAHDLFIERKLLWKKWTPWILISVLALLQDQIYPIPDRKISDSHHRYHGLFMGLLSHTDAETTERVLKRFDLDPKLSKYQMKFYYTLTREEHNELFEPPKIMFSLFRYVAVQMTEPVIRKWSLDYVFGSMRQKARYFGNYPEGSQSKEVFYAPKGPWPSALREGFLDFGWTAFFGWGFLLLLMARREHRELDLSLFFLMVFALTMAEISYVGNGVQDMNRHVESSRFALDLALILTAVKIALTVQDQFKGKAKKSRRR
ncbi:MAG: hypothetical protein JNL01_00580 [Bdellovibrionales bacterium]|nr:hypothetical protein [Bdellovibrionales bacterium]